MRSARRKTTRKKTTKTARVRKGAKAWAAAEVAMLKRAYKTQSATQIAKTLRRSVSSVKAKARTLGLRKPARRRAATKGTTVRRKAAARRPRKTATRKVTARKAAPKRRRRKKG